ncbi:hypothetical protein [Paraburkholderia kirstenboschensis]|uniref:Phage-related protein n=1 Tax=Paraburkholderia kirstenboschensis TaxID=1245436 RepID=A0ABZ0ESQ5_9BURK|nr:hypothetical protein [Paraburkholderia kirstenboschensis]WOD19805.1 hypothetical protein RW095_26715 [Paraburkholderia kirstenboschensis]
MRELPMLFSGAMVRALLDGRKTQTRRIVKLPHNNPLGQWEPTTVGGENGGKTAAGATVPLQGGIWHTRTGDALLCPHGQPGDRLWVRETCAAEELRDGLDGVRYLADKGFMPIADTQDAAERWIVLNAYRGQKGAVVPAIHMPRWASRIALEIVSVRVERLQQIDEASAKAEGVEPVKHGPIWPTFEEKQCWRGYMNHERAYRDTALDSFNSLWRSINRPESWDANPWVWVVEFKRVA